MINFTHIKSHIKAQNSFLTRLIYQVFIRVQYCSLPAPKFIFMPLLILHLFIRKSFRHLLVFFYLKPLFTQYLNKKPKHFILTHSMPYITGSPLIDLGEMSCLNGGLLICARTSAIVRPRLEIAERAFIGFEVQFYIGTEIIIGADCKIAENCILRGYPGHPMDPVARKAGLADNDDSAAAIILENNVWLGYGVTINPGVRIGENSVIAAGSIVTKDIPANVFAAGIPARIIKPLQI